MSDPRREPETSVPIAIGGARTSSLQEPASGAFSLGGGSYLRSYEDKPRINYESIELKYARPAKREKKALDQSGEQSRDAVQKQLARAMFEYLKTKTCYDALPTSSQIVVIDANLPLKTGFIAALETKMPFGVLWDPEVKQYVGTMTVTDYIKVLLRTRTSGESIAELQDLSIKACRACSWMQRGGLVPKELVSVRLDRDLLAALKVLKENHIRRLPVMSHTGEVTSAINYSSLLDVVLERLFDNNNPIAGAWLALLEHGVKDLGIGHYDSSAHVTLETPVHQVLETLVAKKLHCLPIVDQTGRCLDVFTRNDTMTIEQGGTYDVELTLASAIATRPRIPVYCFSPDDTLLEVMKHLRKMHTLIAVDENDRECGYITVPDIFEWLLETGVMDEFT
ncbi:5prime-AMP-activated protein kinase subunit gamma [Diplonema papillatum]|nr:5prime-AMP-activated protein kinase subunit gamma [Diplonema papillatum]